MPESDRELYAQLLRRLAGGEREVEGALFELVYADLKARAHGFMRHQPADHTLQTTALVHEAWLKLGDLESPELARTQFYRLASSAMRSVLVDHARANAADKRGGGAARSALDVDQFEVAGPSVEVLALDEALTRLRSIDADIAEIAELRLFGGLEHSEIAATLDISTSTVERAWRSARAWLRHALDPDTAS